MASQEVNLRALESAIAALRQKPRLAYVLLAICDLVANRRNCRIMVEVIDGVVRMYREVPLVEVDLLSVPGPGVSG